MGLYDEVSVAEGNKVNIPQPKDCYQISSLKCTLSNLYIDKDGYIHYTVDKDYVINNPNLDMYGEDHTGYYRRYLVTVIMNKIEAVWEKEDDNTYTEIFLNPGIKLAAKYMSHRMTPLHQRSKHEDSN